MFLKGLLETGLLETLIKTSIGCELWYCDRCFRYATTSGIDWQAGQEFHHTDTTMYVTPYVTPMLSLSMIHSCLHDALPTTNPSSVNIKLLNNKICLRCRNAELQKRHLQPCCYVALLLSGPATAAAVTFHSHVRTIGCRAP